MSYRGSYGYGVAYPGARSVSDPASMAAGIGGIRGHSEAMSRAVEIASGLGVSTRGAPAAQPIGAPTFATARRGAYGVSAGQLSNQAPIAEAASPAVAGAIIAGTGLGWQVLKYALENRGDINYERSRMEGSKYPNDNREAYDDWTHRDEHTVRVRSGWNNPIDDFWVAFDVTFMTNRHALGYINMRLVEANDAALWGVNIETDIQPLPGAFGENNDVAGVDVNFNFRYSRTVGDDRIHLVTIRLFGNGTWQTRRDEWPEGGPLAASRALNLDPSEVVYNVEPGQEYGPRWRARRPPGLPESARLTSRPGEARPFIEQIAREQGINDTFVATVANLAQTESRNMLALPANTFDARPRSQRPEGRPLITAWGAFQYNRDAWRGLPGVAQTEFPWEANRYDELARPIRKYAQLYRGVTGAGGSDLDAARGIRLWHRTPVGYRRYVEDGGRRGFGAAWRAIEDRHRTAVDSHLRRGVPQLAGQIP